MTYDPFPGILNRLNANYLDGNQLLKGPSYQLIAGNPGGINVKMYQTYKEFFDGNIISPTTTDDVGSAVFTFEKILLESLDEQIVGAVKEMELYPNIGPGVIIKSMVLFDELSQKPMAIVNLRHAVTLDTSRTLALGFGLAFSVVGTNVSTLKDIRLNQNITTNIRTFFIPSGSDLFEDDKPLFISPSDLTSFLDTMADQDMLVKHFQMVSCYSKTQIIGPSVQLVPKEDHYVISVEGPVQILNGFTGIAAMILPYSKNISLGVIFDQLMVGNVLVPGLMLEDGKKINFDFKVEVAD